MFKRFFCFFLLLVVLCAPVSSFAQNATEASLSSVSTYNNRVFHTTLSVNSRVAAFVATLEFDQSKLSFRGAKAVSYSSLLSVNAESGKVTLAFLNENGIEGDVIDFTFKSNSENAYISLAMEQVIDINARVITLDATAGAEVTVTSKVSDKSSSEKPKTEKETPPATESKNYLSLGVSKTKSSENLIFTLAFWGFSALAAVGVTGFILGKNFNSKNKGRQK